MNFKTYSNHKHNLENFLMELHTLKKIIPCNKIEISNMQNSTRNLIKSLNGCMKYLIEINK